MQQVDDGRPWRANFVGALGLLAHAAGRLPFGVSDPILCGASAVELYIGGLWSAADFEVLAGDARKLTAELFALGFRWTTSPGRLESALWHPELRVGIAVAEGSASLDVAALSNLLVMDVDLGTSGSADQGQESLKVVGIEDLIAEQARHGLMDRAPSGESRIRLQTLVGLAQEDVGGEFWGGYLRRRLAWETGGEVVLDLPSGERGGQVSARRTIALTRMQATIRA